MSQNDMNGKTLFPDDQKAKLKAEIKRRIIRDLIGAGIAALIILLAFGIMHITGENSSVGETIGFILIFIALIYLVFGVGRSMVKTLGMRVNKFDEIDRSLKSPASITIIWDNDEVPMHVSEANSKSVDIYMLDFINPLTKVANILPKGTAHISVKTKAVILRIGVVQRNDYLIEVKDGGNGEIRIKSGRFVKGSLVWK